MIKTLYTSIFTLILSSLAVLIFSNLSGQAVYMLKLLSSCILIILGARTIIGGSAKAPLMPGCHVWTMVSLAVVGISVAVDSAIASVLLIDSEINILLVPILLAFCQFVFMCLGQKSANLLRFINDFTRFSGVFLIILGISRMF